MSDEPWEDERDFDWQLPRSERELRERWGGDGFLRVVVGSTIAAVIVAVAWILWGVMR